MKKSEKTLKDLKVGDMVYHTESFGNRIIVSKIIRITKTQLVLDNGHKANIESGREVGESLDMWHTTHYYPATEEDILTANKQTVVGLVREVGKREFDLTKATEKDLHKIVDAVAVIKQYQKKKK